MFFNKLLAASLAAAFALPFTSARAEVITLTTADSAFTNGTLNQGWWVKQGWWGTDNVNNDLNDNYLTGYSPQAEYRSYYTFDLRKIGGEVTSATLKVMQGFQTGNVTLGLWDVSESASVVNNNIGVSQSIFADLGSGKSYGTFSVQPTTSSDYLYFELNSDALQDLRNHSNFFTIGASLVGSPGQFIFGSTGGNVTSLILDVRLKSNDVPEPTSLALFGLAMAGLAFNRRRKA